MSTKTRVIRLLVYDGKEEWLEATIKNSHIKECFICPNGIISEFIVDEFSELVDLQELLATLDKAES